jgi:hypothetical protein
VSVVVAALTPDLRTFVLTLIVIPTVDAIAAATFSWFPKMSGPGRIALVIAATAGALVLLAALPIATRAGERGCRLRRRHVRALLVIWRCEVAGTH